MGRHLQAIQIYKIKVCQTKQKISNLWQNSNYENLMSWGFKIQSLQVICLTELLKF